MSTRLTTGLLSCLMMSLLVGCASSPDGLIRGQSPSAYPMPAGAYSGHGFGAYSQGTPFQYNSPLGKVLQEDVQGRVNAYYGTGGSPHYGAGGYPVSTSYPGAYYGGSGCDNGQCQDPYCHSGQCQNGYCFADCMFGHGQCQHCNGHGCPYCKGTGNGDGGEQWAPTHLYQHMYHIPQNMVYPQNPTPGAITVYPYYTHKGPDDFFYPPLKR